MKVPLKNPHKEIIQRISRLSDTAHENGFHVSPTREPMLYNGIMQRFEHATQLLEAVEFLLSEANHIYVKGVDDGEESED